MDMGSKRDGRRRRPPLTKERVLSAAITLADQGGVEFLTMRRLGSVLGVEAMALYKHLANKDEILDGIVEAVMGEIEIPAPGAEWRTAMRQRAVSARCVLKRHPWAIGVMESRGLSGPATLGYVNAVVGSLRAGGFSVELAGHAFWLLDSYVYGHVIQEVSLPVDSSEQTAALAGDGVTHGEADDYPHLSEIAADAAGIGFTVEGEFTFGLDLILDALDGIRGQSTETPHGG